MNGIYFIVLSSLLKSTLFDVIEVEAEWKRRVLHKRQTEDFNAGGLPSHLPSPPGHKKNIPETTQGHTSSSQMVYPERPNFIGNMVMELDGGHYYEHTGNNDDGSEETTTKSYDMTTEACDDDDDDDDDDEDDDGDDSEEDDDKDEEEEEDAPAPLGLDETILIIVPQFKYTIHGFPAWAGANVRLSLPITIFFEELKWPKPPIPLPPGLNAGFGSLLFNSKFKKWNERLKRRDSRSILSLPPGDTLVGGERATIIPKLEQLLESLGIRAGRDCLLRAVCEVHEAELSESYGFIGEFFTYIFTISHSMFAETHLASYLEAEVNGKKRSCSEYFKKCVHSLFEQDQTRNHCQLGAWNCS